MISVGCPECGSSNIGRISTQYWTYPVLGLDEDKDFAPILDLENGDTYSPSTTSEWWCADCQAEFDELVRLKSTPQETQAEKGEG